MGLFKKSNDGKKPTAKVAKELSKTNKSSERIIPASGWGKNKIGERSTRDNMPVAFVKENGRKSVVAAKEVRDPQSWSGKRQTTTPSINYTPRSGQSRMTIKTYEGGSLVRKEKQGKDLLGRPVVKSKTYGVGGLGKGKEKATLTKTGVKRKEVVKTETGVKRRSTY